LLSKPEPSNEVLNLVTRGDTINTAPEPQLGIEIQDDAVRPFQGTLEGGQGGPVVESKDVVEEVEECLSLLQVLLRLSKSSRALVALVISFVYGYRYFMLYIASAI